VIRRRLTDDDCVRLCERAAAIGFDAVVPVSGSVFWDMHVVRGEYPERAWRATQFQSGVRRAFGGPWRARLVSLANRLQARNATFEPAWNADLCRRVRERVDIPVMLEGGVRERDRMDRLLGDACDLVGMGRPFYAEPRLPARLLDGGAAVCENCNNCTVPRSLAPRASVARRRCSPNAAASNARTPTTATDPRTGGRSRRPVARRG